MRDEAIEKLKKLLKELGKEGVAITEVGADYIEGTDFGKKYYVLRELRYEIKE